MEDIIFENREKRYGAYFLRKNQHWHEWVALAMVCGVLWAAFWGWNWLKEEPKAKEAEIGRTNCPIGIFCPPPVPVIGYEVPILPPCPPPKKQIAFKIPEPVPAWKLCECDDDLELKPKKKLPAKLINHQVKLIQEKRNETTEWFCDCRLIESDPDPAYTIVGELASHQHDLTLNQPAQLINPEILPRNIWRKIEKQKISLLVRIDPFGNYLEHQLEGKLAHRMMVQLAEFVEELRFTPEIQEGQASSAWVQI